MKFLEIKDLTKRYPRFTLKNVSFSLEQGRIMGPIGKNSAGRSTTLKAIISQFKGIRKNLCLLKESLSMSIIWQKFSDFHSSDKPRLPKISCFLHFFAVLFFDF